MIKKAFFGICLAFAVTLISNIAFAFDDFNGLIESRPDDGMGAWVGGGLAIYATKRTRLDDHDGPLEVGACVEVDIHNRWVTEIERDGEWKCRE